MIDPQATVETDLGMGVTTLPLMRRAGQKCARWNSPAIPKFGGQLNPLLEGQFVVREIKLLLPLECQLAGCISG